MPKPAKGVGADSNGRWVGVGGLMKRLSRCGASGCTCYRAVDGQGNTVEFFLSRARGIAAAKAFFRKALKHHREPHSITLDGHRPSHSALRHMGMNGEFNFRGRNPVKIRCCQYLNNVVEQDHRRVKGRLRSMLGFKTFYNARRVIIGIELAQKIHERQFAIPIPWQSNPVVIWRHVMAA